MITKLTKEQKESLDRVIDAICKDIKVRKFYKERKLLRERLDSEGDYSFGTFFEESQKLRKKLNITTAIGRGGSVINKVKEVSK